MVVKKLPKQTLMSRSDITMRLTDAILTTHRQARAKGEDLVASVALYVSVNRDTVLRWWWVDRGPTAWLWHEPQSPDLVAAIGSVDVIQGTGFTRFLDLERAYDAACERVVTYNGAAARWFCGFSFQPKTSALLSVVTDKDSGNVWQRWPDATLVLPEVVVRHGLDAAQLTVNVRVASGRFDVESTVKRIVDRLTRLLWPSEEAQSGGKSQGPRSFKPRQSELAKARETWRQRVRDASLQVRSGRLSKVVLARGESLQLGWTSTPLDALLANLLDKFPDSYRFAVWYAGALFVGASPERLVRVDGRRVELDCLAGTAARGSTPEADQENQAWLQTSSKNLREHRVLVDWMRLAIAPLLTDADIPASPRIRKQSAVQHLYTPVTGWLRDGVSLFDVVSAVHPTPAVAGVPREDALAYISRYEGLDRGWYAGGVGWIDADGNGELCVALRSALMLERESVLFAGGGVMGDSDPLEEWYETEYKLRPMKVVLFGEDR